MKIIHLMPDEKFWECPIYVFSHTKYENEFYAYVTKEEDKLKFADENKVKKIEHSKVNALLQNYSYDVIIFHWLDHGYYDYVSNIPPNKIAIWSSWGGDLYGKNQKSVYPIVLPTKLYKPQTNKIIKENNLQPRKQEKKLSYYIKKIARNIIFFWRFAKEIQQEHKKQIEIKQKQNTIIRRFNYFACVLPIEYDMMKKEKESFQAKYFPFQYTRNNGKDIKRISPEASMILVGNSADPSNNHFDIFKILKERNIKKQLYIPIAYGNGKYADYIKEYIKTKNIEAIIQDKFCVPEEYYQNLSNCKVAIFGHLRQQAMGNINYCLKQGSKIFLYKDSCVYKFYKSKGAYIFNIDDELFNENISEPLSEEQIRKNIEITTTFSLNNFLPKLEKTLEEIEKRICNN